MTKRNKKIILVFSLLFLFFLDFSLVFAAEGLPNPLGENNVDPRIIIGNVINAGLGIVGSLALAAVIYGGFLWVTSAGNDEKIKKGKDILIWSSFGLAVIFMSYAIVTFVITAVAGNGTGSGGTGIIPQEGVIPQE